MIYFCFMLYSYMGEIESVINLKLSTLSSDVMKNIECAVAIYKPNLSLL